MRVLMIDSYDGGLLLVEAHEVGYDQEEEVLYVNTLDSTYNVKGLSARMAMDIVVAAAPTGVLDLMAFQASRDEEDPDAVEAAAAIADSFPD